MFLFDDHEGKSTYLWAPSWAAAERMAVQYGYTLIGQSTGYQNQRRSHEDRSDR